MQRMGLQATAQPSVIALRKAEALAQSKALKEATANAENEPELEKADSSARQEEVIGTRREEVETHTRQRPR